MAKNTDLSTLDYSQAAKRCIEDSNDAMRVVVADGTEFEIALDSAQGDSVLADKSQDSDEYLLTSASSGELLVLDATRFEKAQIYTKTTSAITGAQAIELDVSPVASGDFWVTGGATVTPGTSLNDVEASSIVEICAVRVRLRSDAAVDSGAATVVLVLRS